MVPPRPPPWLLEMWECHTIFSCKLSPFSYLRNLAEKRTAFEPRWFQVGMLAVVSLPPGSRSKST